MQSFILTPTTSQQAKRKRLHYAQQCHQKHYALPQNLLIREEKDVTYKEMKAALKQHFEEKRNFLAGRLGFFRTVQQDADFPAELRNKAKECDFEEQCCVKCQDNALRDRLVMGCRQY